MLFLWTVNESTTGLGRGEGRGSRDDQRPMPAAYINRYSYLRETVLAARGGARLEDAGVD